MRDLHPIIFNIELLSGAVGSLTILISTVALAILFFHYGQNKKDKDKDHDE